MTDAPNTVFLRLEGPLQAWGDNSKFVIRRTMEAPTKSAVLGLICSAMGVQRNEASQHPITERFHELHTLAERLMPEEDDKDRGSRRTVLGVLNTLVLGIRIDSPGIRWWDYHTVGAGYGILTAEGKVKRTASTGEFETLITRREYLCDASFLAVLQGDAELIQRVAQALQDPQWPLFLGRKVCPPSVPIFRTRERGDGTREAETGRFGSLELALASREWSPRYESDRPRDAKRRWMNKAHAACLNEWRASAQEPIAPASAEVWYDVPVSFHPPAHQARLIQRKHVTVNVGEPTQRYTPPPFRPRAAYSSREWTDQLRPKRLRSDQGLCVFCKQPANQMHHTSYRHAGGGENQEDLRSLCRLCHDAVTMVEYGLGMGMDRIDPCDPQWRERIVAKRDEIRRWRSEEGRHRALRQASQAVSSEILEEEG